MGLFILKDKQDLAAYSLQQSSPVKNFSFILVSQTSGMLVVLKKNQLPSTQSVFTFEGISTEYWVEKTETIIQDRHCFTILSTQTGCYQVEL